VRDILADSYDKLGVFDIAASIRTGKIMGEALRLHESTDHNSRINAIMYETLRNEASPENIRICVGTESKFPHENANLTPAQKKDFESRYPECAQVSSPCTGPVISPFPFPIVQYRDSSGLHITFSDGQINAVGTF
jgi:hypothetical protein